MGLLTVMTFDDYLDDEKFRIKSQDVFETVDIKLFKKLL
jgi:hypothetical protein